MMVTNYVLWDVEEDVNGYMPTLGKKPTSRVMKALIKLHGQLQDTRVIEEENVAYRIALPEDSEDEFEELTGYILSQPREDF